jgi:PmbA protein
VSRSATARPDATFDSSAAEAELARHCAELRDRARRAGADEAEAYAARSRTLSVRFEKGDLKLAQADESTSLGLRVFREQRLGFASTNQTGERSLAATVADAIALTRCSPPDAHNRLPAARAPAPTPFTIEPALASLSIERAVELGLELVARARAFDGRISIDNAQCEIAVVTHAIDTSTGAAAVESDAQLSLSIFGMAIDGADVGGFHYDGDGLRRLAEVEPAITRIAEGFARTAIGNLGAAAAESYRGPVLFAPDAFLDVFVAPLCSAASAIAVQRGRSALAGKIGSAIAPPAFDLDDDPSDPTLAGAAGFDREGQPIGRFALVEKGVLRSYLYNGYAAAVEGRGSTGHARGGPRSTPALGPHALVVGAGGGGSAAEMQRALGRGPFVQRFSGSVDPSSGDFSGVAKSARWIEGGKIVRSLRETLISGNVFDLLPRIALISSERERCSGSALAPWAIVDGLSVTAG